MIEAFSAQLADRPLQDTVPVTQNDLIAYFPQSRNSQSASLQASFQDVPQGEPDLVQALLHPWPDRSLLFRLASKSVTLKFWT